MAWTNPMRDAVAVALERETSELYLERRAEWRHGCEIEVWMRGPSGITAGFSENISVGGLFVATLRPPPVGERVVIQLEANTDDDAVDLQLRGVVRWIRSGECGPTGCGVEFTALRREQRWALSDLVESVP